MATAGDRHGHSRAETEWQQALELEKKLKATYRKKSFYDPEARTLRSQLRTSYESLLFIDAGFAAANDVEVALWRAVFYRPIEEFRSRLKQAEKGGEVGAAQVPKVAAAFLKFLEDASLFYRRLIMQLQAAYGDVGVKLELPKEVAVTAGGTNGAAPMHSSTGSSAPRDVRTSVHRCLIYLGDLSRYTAQAAPKAAQTPAQVAAASQQHPAARPDWLKAAHYYRLAARVLPRSGNPHNQLAVMAVLTGDELRAVYHYARSLCVGIPFQTAKENLALLFEQNRQRYADYVQRRQQQQQGQVPAGQLLADLSVCYVRLSGLFFDKINQHEFQAISTNAAAALAAFAGHPALMDVMQRQPRADCTPLHLIILGIFSVQNCRTTPAEARSAPAGAGYGDAAQRGQLRSRALATVLKTGRLLCQAAAAACNTVAASATAAVGGAANGSAATPGSEWKGVACLLVAVNVLFYWLAAQPAVAGIQIQTATEDEVKCRATFWSAAAQVVTAVAAAYPSSKAAVDAAVRASVGVGNGSTGADSCDGGALPEELELLGFEPLRSKHYFHVTDVGKLAVDEPATRTCRMLAAARVVANNITGPEQQQLIRQLSASGSSSSVQPQTIRQLATGVQQFAAAVAELAARPAGGLELQQHAAAAAEGSAGAAVAMEIDSQQQQHQQQAGKQPVQQPEEDADEEVIVFKPRLSRVSTMSDDATVAAAAAGAVPSPTARLAAASAPAAAATASRPSPRPTMLPARVPPPSVVAAAAAEPPPLPQQLLASRQQGRASGANSQAASGVSSPAGAASPQRVGSYSHFGQQQQQQQQPSMIGGPQPMLTSPVDSPTVGRISPPAAAGASAAAAATSAGLLHGHAATALDLQQGQAASDALLARLTSRQSGIAMNPAAAASGPAGFNNIGGAGGLGLSSNLPPAPAGYWSSGGASGGSIVGTGSGGFSRSAIGGLANPLGVANPNTSSTGATGLSAGLRSQPPSPAVFGGAVAAAPAGGQTLASPHVGLGQQQPQQQFGSLLPGAFTGSTTAHHNRGFSMDALGLNVSLGLGLAQQVNPNPAGQLQNPVDDGFQGFDPLGFGLNSAMNSQTFAAGAGDSMIGGIAFDDQLLLGLGASGAFAADDTAGARPISIAQQPVAQQQQQQQHCADSQLEQTARAAADSILSPEIRPGPALMQRHQQQRQEQQQQYDALAAAAAAADAVAAQALAAATGLTSSANPVPQQFVPQQQQQLLQPRLSGDMYSPTAAQAQAAAAPGPRSSSGNLAQLIMQRRTSGDQYSPTTQQALAAGLTGSGNLAQQLAMQQQQQRRLSADPYSPSAQQALGPTSGFGGSGNLAQQLALQQQQQQRRLSGDPYSPTAQQAVGYGRSSDALQQPPPLQQQQQRSLARVSAPSVLQPGDQMPSSPSILAAAAAAAPANAGDRPSGSYAMFSGPDLFASADVPVLSAAAIQERQRRISSSSMTGSHSSHQGIAPVPGPLPPPLEQQMQMQHQQQLLQQQGVRLYPQSSGLERGISGVGLPQGEGLGACDSPTSPDGLTLLDYLAQQQRMGQMNPPAAGATAAAAAAGQRIPPGFSVSGGLGYNQGLQQQQQQQQGDWGSGSLGPGLGLGVGVAPGAGGFFHGAQAEVLLPPVDLVQSQNPFAS